MLKLSFLLIDRVPTNNSNHWAFFCLYWMCPYIQFTLHISKLYGGDVGIETESNDNITLSNLIHPPKKWIQLRTDRILQIRHIQPLVNVTLEDSPSPKSNDITLGFQLYGGPPW